MLIGTTAAAGIALTDLVMVLIPGPNMMYGELLWSVLRFSGWSG